MWIFLNDAFFSIVKKDCKSNEVMVRARLPGDIEKVFGSEYRSIRVTNADYLYRATIPLSAVARAMVNEIFKISYPSFKESVSHKTLHRAYLKVWKIMASVQNPPPYSIETECPEEE